MEITQATPINPVEIYEKLRSVTREGRVCFIFGAGASYGYSRIPSQLAPPIVAALFDDKNPVVAEIIRKPQHEAILRRREDINEALTEHGGDLEAYLGHLFSLNENHELFTRLILYMQDICFRASRNIDLDRGTNNYLRLIYRMEGLSGTNWSCITFNYDTILEKTFIAAGSDARTFSVLGHFAHDPKIIKVHGGINFRYSLMEREPSMRSEGALFKLMMAYPAEPKVGNVAAINVSTDSLPTTFNSLLLPKAGGAERMHSFDFPAMMVPIHNTNRTHSGFFQKAVDDAVIEVGNAKLVIAIGYNFGDKIFVDALKTLDLSGKEIILVSGVDFSESPNDSPAYRTISQFWNGPLHLFHGARFSEFVDSIGPSKPASPS